MPDNGKVERFIQTALTEWAYAACLSDLGPPHRTAAGLAPTATTGIGRTVVV